MSYAIYETTTPAPFNSNPTGSDAARKVNVQEPPKIPLFEFQAYQALHADRATIKRDKIGDVYAPLAQLRNYRSAVAQSSGVVRTASGVSTGAVDSVAQEAVQILGQIVVDRASAQAYQLIKDKLLELLGCQSDGTSTKHHFDATCGLLVPLRIEDVASSRDALLAAVVVDVVKSIENKVSGNKTWNDALNSTFASLLATGVIPLIARPKNTIDDTVARTILDALLTYATNDIGQEPKPGEKALVVGLTAYLQCLHPGGDQPGDLGDPAKVLAACDVGANVDGLTTDPTIRPAAHAAAQALVAAGTPTPTGGDPHVRVVHALDLTFSSGCMVLRDTATGVTPRFACDNPMTLTTVVDALALMQPIADDAVLGETNALIAATVHALQLTNSDLESKDANRVFILVGGLLDYAATYTATTGTTTDDLHTQRTKILESLTTSMTNRTGRAGDTILSIGGALRLVAGRTWSADSSSVHAFYGPLSLPLGVALTHLPSGSCPLGIHIQIDALDLG
ncbi:MAG TPA: hypothetical protein VK989_04065, partial [Polyangia bacterium]|nr:hypothetical protein [Polyangia bacterium]